MGSPPLTASVIGCGTGGRLSLEALSASLHFRVLAATDLRPEVRASLEKEFPGLRTFGSHQEMFVHCPTDVVCVSTYPPSHESIVLDTIELPSLRGIWSRNRLPISRLPDGEFLARSSRGICPWSFLMACARGQHR